MKLFDVYPIYDVEPTRATGSWVWSQNGNKYLDLYGGHAVISIGHNHPHWVAALKKQLDKISFYSNSVRIPQQNELADKLSDLSGYYDYQLFLCNSGAEANENALKLASFHNGRRKVVAFNGSFHGRTSLAVALTDDEKISAPVNQFESVEFIPLEDFDLAEKTIDDQTCAVIIEGIQGVAGARSVSTAFMQFLRNKCTAVGASLILDEIQSGCGRTGKFFAHQHAGIKPDLITMAKGIGNGFPIGAVLIAPGFQPKKGQLGTTFGGNYLACASSIAVMDVLQGEQVMSGIPMKEEIIRKELSGLTGLKEIHGKGLMLGLEFDFPVANMRNNLVYEHFLFTGSSACPNTLRLLPSLTITIDELMEGLSRMKKIY